jgi:hypothetical protein
MVQEIRLPLSISLIGISTWTSEVRQTEEWTTALGISLASE